MRGPSPLTCVLLPLLLLLAASTAAAQPAPPKPGAAQRPGAPPPAAAAPPPAPDAPPPPPPKIDVNDPLLAAVPPPAHTVNGWREALNLLSSRSVDLALAKQEVERAEGQRRIALGAALTTVTAQGTLSQQFIQTTSGPSDTVIPVIGLNGVPIGGIFSHNDARPYQGPTASASLSASQPIFAPRAWYAIGTADLNIKSAKLTENDKRRTSLGTVASAIVQVYTAERVSEINRAGLKNALQHLDLAQRKARLGDGTRLDVLRAEQDVATARGTLISGDESLLKARETLGIAFGSSESYGVPQTISLNEMEQALRSTCSPGNIDQRADVVQARNDLEVAKRGVTDAKLAFAPTASVSTTLSATSSTNSASAGAGGATVSSKNYGWSIQGVLTIPIWEGGARYGAMRIARANEEEARIRLDALNRTATLESTQSLRGVLVAEQAKQVAEHNRDLARESARLAEKAYAAGAGTSFDLVDTSRQERSAELNLAVQELELISAKISALLATANCSY